jgi:sigma-E factor negative regulatory protein RseA
MNIKESAREQISAFADGELAEQHMDLVLASLRQTEGKDDWELYHQIGDVLRSDDMAVSLSSGFAARMAARLEMESTIVAPIHTQSVQSASSQLEEQREGLISGRRLRMRRRWALSGMAAVAAAAVAFVATPQLMVATSNAPASGSSASQSIMVAAQAPEGVVLRDPRIDDYLLAHQHFSPSVFSTAQYARTATFATDSNK